MSHYGVVYPEFWTGPTGRAIAKAGGRDAQLLALYLVSCRHATMIGLYYLPFDVMRQETRLSARALVRALELLREPCQFASYDPTAEVVWVYEMARFRVLGAQAKKALTKDDNRVSHCQRLYAEVVENSFLESFFDHYHNQLKLTNRRSANGDHNRKPLPSPFEAPSKPVNRSVRTEISSRDQRSGTGPDLSTSKPAPRREIRADPYN